MSLLSTNRLSQFRTRMNASIFTPLLLVLTLIAVVHALQSHAAALAGSEPAPALLRILVSKLVYYLYFAVLAWAVGRHSRRIALTRRTALPWSAIHAGTLAGSFIVHVALTAGADTIVLGTAPPASMIVLFFNTPAVWIETFAYAIFLLGFLLVEYQRINRENEIRCAELEARLTHAKLQELRNGIQPEFLFNTLDSILLLLREHRNHDANHVLALLGDFLRTTVYGSDRNGKSESEELGLLTQFIERETARIGVPPIATPRDQHGITHRGTAS